MSYWLAPSAWEACRWNSFDTDSVLTKYVFVKQNYVVLSHRNVSLSPSSSVVDGTFPNTDCNCFVSAT